MSLGGGSSAPAAPDPTTTSAAQTASNEQTALYNFGLNNPSVNTPLGSSTYTQTSPGGYDNAAYQAALSQYEDASNAQFTATGQGYSSAPPELTSYAQSPTYTQNINLSPAEQTILDQQQGNIIQQGQNATTAQNNVTNLLQTPYNLQGNIPQTLSGGDQQADLQNAENSLYGQQTQYLDPQFSQEQSQLQAQLQNQGLAPGSNAYNTAMQNFGLQKQQAYSNAADTATSGGAAYQAQLSQTGLANQAQQAQLYTQQYQEPLNLYSSLMSGTSPTMPQFSGVNTASAAPTNVLGAYQNSYQDQLNAYNAQTGASNSTTSGLFGLGGSALSASLSALL